MASAGPDLHVLLVEDNPSDARLVRDMLRYEGPGVEITHALRLDDALVLLRSHTFAAVLLDLTLPDSAGLHTFVRAQSAAGNAAIIVLTGIADEDMAATAVRQGAQDYLVKGDVDGRALYKSIRYAIERQKGDEALKASEAKYRNLIEGSIQGILIHHNGVIQLANRALADLLRVADHASLVGTEIWAFIRPEDRIDTREKLRHRNEGQPLPTQYEFRAMRADGSTIWLECAISRVPWNDEMATLATIIDITERQRAEQELRESEERFRQLADNIKEAFFVLELPSYRLLYLSRMWEELWGMGATEAYLASSVWMDAVHEDDRSAFWESRTMVETGQPASSVFRLVRRDGTQRWARARMFPVRNDAHVVYRIVGLVEDITDVRHAEDQLRQAQKMEAIGRLAGGIAHDFNNLLTAILGYTQLIQDDLGPHHPAMGHTRRLTAAGQSAADLTRQLLAFSRRQVFQAQVLDLTPVIIRAESLLRRLIGENIALSVKAPAMLPKVKADPGQIEQVIMNLAVNARDAMPDGGRLTIEASAIELDDAWRTHHTGGGKGPHVMISVTDTGIGMDASLQQHVWEPFFTTKALGHGTGLGLATVYGIVKQSLGSIWIYSEPGQGSTFKVYLPVVEADEAAPSRTAANTAAHFGTETILVVEDQREILALTASTLRRRGYTVIEANNGADAIRKSRLFPDEIHLLLTDVIMPEITGRKTAETLILERPSLRVVYMSGYTDDTIVSRGFLEPGLAFVEKPFTTDALMTKIREVIDATEPPRW